MKFFYRGHSYDVHEQEIPATEVVQEGKYRGKEVKWTQKQTRVKHSHRLVYRGVRHLG